MELEKIRARIIEAMVYCIMYNMTWHGLSLLTLIPGNWQEVSGATEDGGLLHLRYGQQRICWYSRGLPTFHQKVKKIKFGKFFPGQTCRFIDLYGEKLPELSEEEMKIFNVWMEHWLDQRLVEFHISRHFQAKAGLWRWSLMYSLNFNQIYVHTYT